MNERDSLIILNAIPGLTNNRIRQLLEGFGSANRILGLAKDELTACGLLEEVAQNILQFPKENFLKNELELVEKNNVQVITHDDPQFPNQLKEISDSPILLYVKGEIPSDNHWSIAIVGSRKSSLYGISIAGQFSMRLAELGITIVSGLARGIDTAAHKATLKAHGKTIAVLGNGLAHVYPSENKDLMDEISKTGAVISEFPMQMPPLAYNFPRRNRIISGLSMGVVVVEAAQKSGALITADFALEQGREVFAVPGKVDSPSSKGVHELIKQGAKLITCVEDILEELKDQMVIQLKSEIPQERQKIEESLNLSEFEKTIYDHISDRPVHVDELANIARPSGLPVLSVLLQLELKHLVRQLPGKYFITERK